MNTIKNTAYITHPVYLKHDNGYEHPESPVRLLAIEQHLKKCGLYQALQIIAPPEISREQLERIHSPEYLDFIKENSPTRL
ncbi:MAG: hypothetical protein KZQ64_13660 [gamma proteobacterium symbiont of Bathyaustriella thionipta]|nr:hypothetical protein [gamma proteobacterium symbiont of Bathyaustriella thionipta]MCU7949276.1 hypothetical protein [gamma proteobacterium symbiont of Bathyaustriella thionipta]MCU7954416.1 hypothetical protein [gamma proteobacterium symbiont of Bathyaustriella thionipta]MCU7955863.1 hypothetical protein [gamma proteobacterium symbiont of Bathyaustriella thionipta]MCU7967549.1 hypothetical protein [gamma proteobacterium symbiont of Bathyaustriella thionipta]